MVSAWKVGPISRRPLRACQASLTLTLTGRRRGSVAGLTTAQVKLQEPVVVTCGAVGPEILGVAFPPAAASILALQRACATNGLVRPATRCPRVLAPMKGAYQAVTCTSGRNVTQIGFASHGVWDRVGVTGLRDDGPSADLHTDAP